MLVRHHEVPRAPSPVPRVKTIEPITTCSIMYGLASPFRSYSSGEPKRAVPESTGLTFGGASSIFAVPRNACGARLKHRGADIGDGHDIGRSRRRSAPRRVQGARRASDSH